MEIKHVNDTSIRLKKNPQKYKYLAVSNMLVIIVFFNSDTFWCCKYLLMWNRTPVVAFEVVGLL